MKTAEISSIFGETRAAEHCWTASASLVPHFICGDARQVLAGFHEESIDFCMTSPPYWGHRQYSHGGIGLENTCQQYVDNLCSVFAQVHRVLKDAGSFW